MQVTHMTDTGDLIVVNAARVSFEKESWWEEDGCLKMKDAQLIEYLAKHHHWLPFRHPSERFRCKAPIFVARQAVKHQVGMSWSEVSRRYVDSPPEFYTPEVWRKRASDKKQGSLEEEIDMPCLMDEEYEGALDDLVYLYKWMLEEGVAPEQARMVLPQSMYTEWVWTGTLLSWAHFVKQRTYPDAQKEIQEFASLFTSTLERLYPVSWRALMNEYNP